MAAFARNFFMSLLSDNLCKTHVSIFFSTSTGSQITRNIVSSYSELLIQKYNLSPQTASKVASVIPTLNNPQNAESLLCFLKQTGFSNTQLDKILTLNSGLLCSSLDGTIKPKIKVIEDLGCSAGDVAEIVANHPSILHQSLNNKIVPTLSLLRDLLGSNDQVVRFLKRPGWKVFADIQKTLLPNIKFLKSCGVTMDQILHLMFTFPNFFTIKPENMRRCVEKADKLGAVRTSKLFIYAARAVSSMCDETLEIKLKTFQDLGFSEDDILRIVREAPVVLSVSGEKIKRVKEVLLETGKYDIFSIIHYPISLLYSVESRYKPRLQVLRDLEKKDIIKEWPCLGTLCVMPDKKFFERYIDPDTKEFSGAFIQKNVVRCGREMELVQKDIHDSFSRST